MLLYISKQALKQLVNNPNLKFPFFDVAIHFTLDRKVELCHFHDFLK